MTKKKNSFKIEAQVVKGECPTCSQITTSSWNQFSIF